MRQSLEYCPLGFLRRRVTGISEAYQVSGIPVPLLKKLQMMTNVNRKAREILRGKMGQCTQARDSASQAEPQLGFHPVLSDSFSPPFT